MQSLAVGLLLLGAVAYLTLLSVRKSRARKHGACAHCGQGATPPSSTAKAVAPDLHA